MGFGIEAGRQRTESDTPFARWEILIGVVLPVTVTLIMLVWWVFWLKMWSGPLAGFVFYMGSTTYAFATWKRAGGRTGQAFRAGWLRFTFWIGLIGNQWLAALLLLGGAAALASKDFMLFSVIALLVGQIVLYQAILARLLASPMLDDLPRTPMLFGTLIPPLVSLALCAW